MQLSISEKVSSLISDALERGVGGQEIEYDVSMIAVPGQGGQPQPMLGLSFTIQALNLAEGHSVMFLMPPTVPSQEDMDGLIRKVVENLVKVRHEAAAHAQNGHKDLPPNVSPSGLILPK